MADNTAASTAAPEPDGGLIFSYIFDGEGGGRQIGWDGIAGWTPEQGVLWIHFDRTGEKVEAWMQNESGIPAAAVETLLTPAGNRPRAYSFDDALLVLLRGVNLNPGERPEDMVVIHAWLEANRIITLRRRTIRAALWIRDELEAGRGPKESSSFLTMLAGRLLEPMQEHLGDLEERVDAIGEGVFGSETYDSGDELLAVRELAIAFRRHVAPQRDAVRRIPNEKASWLKDEDRAFLREDAEKIARFVEDLDEARDRASVFQEELDRRTAERTNRTVYVLTVFSALMLPAALLTGLFGINVAGMPWTKDESGFWLILIGLPVLAVVEFAVLRWFRIL